MLTTSISIPIPYTFSHGIIDMALSSYTQSMPGIISQLQKDGHVYKAHVPTVIYNALNNTHTVICFVEKQGISPVTEDKFSLDSSCNHEWVSDGQGGLKCKKCPRKAR